MDTDSLVQERLQSGTLLTGRNDSQQVFTQQVAANIGCWLRETSVTTYPKYRNRSFGNFAFIRARSIVTQQLEDRLREDNIRN
jgi:hypothetical protein